MIAVMKGDNYIDLVLGYPYEVTKVFKDGHIKIKDSMGIYDSRNFVIMQDGKEISLEEAYKQYRKASIKQKLPFSQITGKKRIKIVGGQRG